MLKAQSKVIVQDARRTQRKNFMEAVNFQKRPMNIGAVGRSHSETRIVPRKVNIPQERIGFLHRGNAGQTEFFNETVLMGCMSLFNTPLACGELAVITSIPNSVMARVNCVRGWVSLSSSSTVA